MRYRRRCGDGRFFGPESMDTLLDTVTSLVSALILSSRTFLGRSLPLVSKDCLLAHSPNLFLKSSDGVRPSWWGCWARDYSRSTPPASRRSLNQVPIATCEWKIDKEPCFTPIDWLKGLITKNCILGRGAHCFRRRKWNGLLLIEREIWFISPNPGCRLLNIDPIKAAK